MSSENLEGFDNLGKFFDDDHEDSWEKNEDKAEIISDRYQDKDFIASGALKNVFKVFDNKMKRCVALAELKDEIPEEEYEAFINEARLTSALRHPNIITVHDFGFNEVHIPYFTMELKVGDTLDEIIKNKKRDLSELLEIFIKVCDATAYAHSENVIHLDLKPANIQVGEFGEVQLCDWGLSKKASNVITENTIKGTPGFMAPEQVIPGETIDFKADIFALGGILYSILTGNRPIEGGSKTAILSTVKEGVKPPIERFPDNAIPESLNAVVCKAMDVDKDVRYKNVEALKGEVANYLLGRSTNAENAGFIKELALFVKRNKQICLLAFVSALVLIASGLIFLVEIKKHQNETETALEKLKVTHIELKASQEKEKSLFEQKEKTFKLFLQASKEHEQMYNLLQGSELTHAYELMIYPLYFGSPKENLEKSLKILEAQNKSDNPRPWLNDLIVLNLFISQEYRKLQEFKSSKYKGLIEIAKKYLEVERSPLGVLLDKDFIDLLVDVNSLAVEDQNIKEDVVERSICYALDAKGLEFIHGKIVKELIKSWNPKWDKEQFSYKKSTGFLKVTGTNLIRLKSKNLNSSQKCYLRFLRIEKLDLSGSGITSLSHIDGLSIKTVDIRNTGISNLHPHNATKSITEVYLNSDQFDEESKAKIPKNIKLIYKD